MKWTRFLMGVGLALSALALAAPADALAADKVLVLRTDGTAYKAPERAAVDAAIAARLKLYPDIEQVAAPEGDLTDMMIDLECIDLDGDCLGRVGAQKGAARVVYVELSKKGTGVEAVVKWVDTASKAITRTDTVSAKTIKAAPAAVAEALELELGPLPAPDVVTPDKPVEPAAPAGTIIIETNRIQAQIFVGEEYAGTGTATIERPAGSYTLRIAHPGDETQLIDVKIGAGETVTRQVTLKSAMFGDVGTVPPATADEDDSSWIIWVVVGAVVVAGAATAIALASGGDDEGPTGTLLLGIDPSGAWRDPATVGGRR
jgi:hypothetical protein